MTLRGIFQTVLGVLGALALAPLTLNMEKLTERLGYDQFFADNGSSILVKMIAALDSEWLHLIAAGLLGGALALLIDAYFRKTSPESKSSRRRNLGYASLNLAEKIQYRIDWGSGSLTLGPELVSLMLDYRKDGLLPVKRQGESDDAALSKVVSYLQMVGTFLINDHYDQALAYTQQYGDKPLVD